MTTTDVWRNETRTPAELLAHPRNPRTHSPEQVLQVRASIREFGFTNPVLLHHDGEMIAGHCRTEAARAEGLEVLPVRVRDSAHPLTAAQVLALMVADNKLAENAGWDDAALASIMVELRAEDYNTDLTGFDADAVDALVLQITPGRVNAGAAEETPALPKRPRSKLGDVWLLGEHRVMCGDARELPTIDRLLAGAGPSPLLHADPPYGMGKESDGVENDNIYRLELCQFQMEWWAAWRPRLTDNASAYIWGNPEELWRLWYAGGLCDSERLTLRNEIVWDKQSGFGMRSEGMRSFTISTERCLFFMLGQQASGNVNKSDFWEGFELLRAYLEGEAIAAGITPRDIARVCGVGMYSHWFSKSQWCLIPPRHYETLRGAYPGHFAKPYAELRKSYDGTMGDEDRMSAKQEFYALRAYFDNTHDSMAEVWQFPRVHGEERFEHATPKPVAMIERCVRSSTREGDVVLEPFAGTGTTLMACELAGRRCRTMELAPAYVDVTVERWQKFTGGIAIREADGQEFNETRPAE